jgi:hypothetical protein
LLIAKDAFRRPEVATQARALIYKWVTFDELSYIAGTSSDPNIKTAVSEVIAQSSQPSKIQKFAESANPSIQREAKSVLDAKWVVWIASVQNPDDAKVIEKSANEKFAAMRMELKAEVSSPSDNGTSYWAVSVGKKISLEDAQIRVQKARSAGFADAFIAGFRW